MICILNCCKVIFGKSRVPPLISYTAKTECFVCAGLIRHVAGSDQTSADTFLPILIFVVLRANPDNMISNIE